MRTVLALTLATMAVASSLAGCWGSVCAPQPCGGRAFALTVRLVGGPITPVSVSGPSGTSCATTGSTTTCSGSAPAGDTDIVIAASGYQSRTLRLSVAAMSDACFRCRSDAITEDVGLLALALLVDSGPMDAAPVDASPPTDAVALDDATDDVAADPFDATAAALDAPGVDAELFDAP